jgi:phage-related protein (TIGR01555 family)
MSDDLLDEDLTARLDGWVNQIAGLGVSGRDRGLNTFLCRRAFLDQETLDNLYAQNPIARRICDRPAADMTREGFTVKGVDPGIVEAAESDMQDLQLAAWLATGERWARQYGGALGIIDAHDGETKNTPLNKAQLTRINRLHIVDCNNARPRGVVRFSATGQGIPEQYEVTWPDNHVSVVHKSRTVRFDGIGLPGRLQQERDYWGMSELEPVYDDVRRLYIVRQYLENFIHEVSIVVMKIKNLRKMSIGKDGSGRANADKVVESLQSLRDHATIFNWLGIDADDEYRTESKPTAGLEALETRFVEAVRMATDIPGAIMLNEVVGGLNSGENAGEMRAYYDWIGSRQNERFTPIVTHVLDLNWIALANRLTKFRRAKLTAEEFTVPTEYTIEWKSLWRQAETEAAAQDKTTAETDAIRINSGVVTAEEVRRARVVDGLRGDLRIEPDVGEDGKPVVPLTVASAAQVAALLDLAEKVGGGLVPPQSGVALAKLLVPSLTDQQATEIIWPNGGAGEYAAGVAAAADLPAAGTPPADDWSAVIPVSEDEVEVEAAASLDMPPDDCDTAAAIAEYLRISPATIRTMAKKGQIRYWKYNTIRRYSLAEVAAAGSAHMNAPPPAPPAEDESGDESEDDDG